MILGRTFFGVSLSCLLLVSCGKKTENAPEAPAIVVEAIEATLSPFVDAYRTSASLEPWEHADIASEIPGRVLHLGAKEGDRVRAGSVLARLDAAVLAGNVAEVQSRSSDAGLALTDAKADLSRVERLHREGVASQQELENARIRVERAEEAVRGGRGSTSAISAQMNKTVIVSPIHGVVTFRGIERGEMASPGQLLFRVENLSSIKVVMQLPAQDVRNIRIGNTVQVFDSSGDTFTGKVTYVSPSADPQTRTVKVEATVDNREGRLRSGIFAEAEIVRSTIPSVVVVPRRVFATQTMDTGVLFVIEGDKIRRREVRIAAHGEESTAITDGLRAGEKVVGSDVATLTDGARVAVKSSAP